MTPQSRRDPSPFLSLSKWGVELVRRLWNVHVDVQDSETFLFAFQSPWQRRMLLEHGSNMIMIDATHNSVNNYFLSDGSKCNLFTIMIRDPYVGKGVPVAWAFTASAAMSVVLKLPAALLLSNADILSNLAGLPLLTFSHGFNTAQGWYLNLS